MVEIEVAEDKGEEYMPRIMFLSAKSKGYR